MPGLASVQNPTNVFMGALHDAGYSPQQAQQIINGLQQMAQQAQRGQTPQVPEALRGWASDVNALYERWIQVAPNARTVANLSADQARSIFQDAHGSPTLLHGPGVALPEERGTVMTFGPGFEERAAPPQQVAYSVAVRGGESYRVVLNYELTGANIPGQLRALVESESPAIVGIRTMRGEDVSLEDFRAAITAEGARVTAVVLPGQELKPYGRATIPAAAEQAARQNLYWYVFYDEQGNAFTLATDRSLGRPDVQQLYNAYRSHPESFVEVTFHSATGTTITQEDGARGLFSGAVQTAFGRRPTEPVATLGQGSSDLRDQFVARMPRRAVPTVEQQPRGTVAAVAEPAEARAYRYSADLGGYLYEFEVSAEVAARLGERPTIAAVRAEYDANPNAFLAFNVAGQERPEWSQRGVFAVFLRGEAEAEKRERRSSSAQRVQEV